MKKLNGIVLSFLLCLTITVPACKKDETNNNTPQTTSPPEVTYEVEYRFTTELDGLAVNVEYRNADSVLVEIPLGGVSEWTQSITRSDVPFQAQLTVDFDNQTLSTEQYTLAIYVDGELSDYLTGQVPAGAPHTAVLEHLVE